MTRKLFYMGVMWLISSDNCADGSCAMLAVTLGNIFGAKTCWKMISPNEMKRSASFLSAPKQFATKAKMLPCYGSNSVEVSVLRPRLPSEFGGVSTRASYKIQRNRKQQKTTKLRLVDQRASAVSRGTVRTLLRPELRGSPQILRLQLRGRSDMLQMSGSNLAPCLRLCLHFQGKCAVSCPMRVQGCGGGPRR